METFYILALLAGSLIVFNCVGMYVVFQTYFEVKERRLYQVLFIWLVPFIGATLAIYINREDYFEDRRLKKIGNNSNITDSEAINMASSIDR